MSGAVLLILMFYILGLFYGMCGSTPSEVRKQVLKIFYGNLKKYLQVYTGDCCDRSTGANMLASAAYLTFLLAAPLLLLTTAHFIIGESCAELIRYCGNESLYTRCTMCSFILDGLLK